MRRALTIAIIGCIVAAAAPASARNVRPTGMLFPDGSYRYAFGGTVRPMIRIQAGFLCDIALQDGEKIHDIFISDSARWKVSTGWSGPNIAHVVVKPTQAGLRTTLTILTDRRAYHIDLVSTHVRGQEFVSFYYPLTPAERSAKLTAERAKLAAERKPAVPPQYACTGLDSSYTASGAKSLWPASVCNDGKQTYVNLPAINGDLPIVKDIGADGKDARVNYSFDNVHNEFTVDGTPDRVVLVRGRDRIVLTRVVKKVAAATPQPQERRR